MLPKRDTTNNKNKTSLSLLMSLYTKCIFAPATPADGIRISVMSRHTLNDGITPDERITDSSYHMWRKELAPPPRVVGAYYRGEIRWPEFETQYKEHLQRPEISDVVQKIARRAMTRDITFLCVEPTADYCHRRLLAEECRKYQPELVVEHK